MKNSWQGHRVLIIGAARQGLALARFLSSQGAHVTITDQRTKAQLSKEVCELAQNNITWHLGEHPVSLLEGVDLVCVSGGVALTIPIIQEARIRQIPLSNDSQIFLENVTCPVIGITGSAGKTTTTSLIGEMARRSTAAPEKVWIGGNIGTPLIEKVDQIQSDHLVILELSSFQLELMTCSPQIALITNITPNHLDRHGTLANYTHAKANILVNQSTKDWCVLNHEDIGSWNLRTLVKGSLFSFGLRALPDGKNFIFLDGERVVVHRNGQETHIASIASIKLRGKHNLYNILAACALAELLQLSHAAIQDVISSFKGVPHRLELVAEKHGVRWYDDSIATAPERTIAAIESFNEPIVLLLGGKDKNLPWERLAEMLRQKVDHVVLFGVDGSKIEAALGSSNLSERPYSIVLCDNLEEAVQAAYQISKAGDVVLLSPGATSYDQFKDFEERGERFRLCVHQLP